MGFSGGSDGKESACNAGDLVWALDGEDPQEKGNVTHSSILAWRLLWIEEPRSLVGYSPQGHRDWDMIERLILWLFKKFCFWWVGTRTDFFFFFALAFAEHRLWNMWASVLVAHGLSCPWVVNLPVPRIKPVSPDLAGRLSNTGPSGKSKTVRLRQEAFFLFSTSKLLNIYVFIPSFNSVHFYCLYLEVM